jgi:hypothetical protein
MNERAAAILAFHATKSFGSRENLIRQHQRVADLYRSLAPEEAAELARLVLEGPAKNTAKGIYYLFICGRCGVAAANCQQS